MKRLTPEEFFREESGHGESHLATQHVEPKDLFALMQAYHDHCEESAWQSVDEQLPGRWDDYPLSRNCFLFNGKEYLIGFYSYAHSQWESDEYAPIEGITHWCPLPPTPQKIPANAPQTPQEEKI